MRPKPVTSKWRPKRPQTPQNAINPEKYGDVMTEEYSSRLKPAAPDGCKRFRVARKCPECGHLTHLWEQGCERCFECGLLAAKERTVQHAKRR